MRIYFQTLPAYSNTLDEKQQFCTFPVYRAKWTATKYPHKSYTHLTSLKLKSPKIIECVYTLSLTQLFNAGTYFVCPVNCLRATRPLTSNSRMSPSSLPATISLPSPLKLPPYAVSRKRVKLRMGSWEYGPYTWIWYNAWWDQHTACVTVLNAELMNQLPQNTSPVICTLKCI